MSTSANWSKQASRRLSHQDDAAGASSTMVKLARHDKRVFAFRNLACRASLTTETMSNEALGNHEKATSNPVGDGMVFQIGEFA